MKHLCVTYPPMKPIAACGFEGALVPENATRVCSFVTCQKCKATNEFKRRAAEL